MNKLKLCPFCGSGARPILPVCIHTGKEMGKVVRCYYCEAQTDYYDTYEEAVAAWNTRASSWIKCEKQKPKNEQRVLIYFNGNHIDIARFIEEDELFIFFEGDIIPDKSVIAWQPLPELPEEE
jgi:Lar family restriction alleviation protein